MRKKLPDDRQGVIHHFTLHTMTEDGVKEIKGYITANIYPDTKRLGEIFLTIGKPGSSERSYDMWAIAVSMGLQYGIPVRDLLKKFVSQNIEPNGYVTSEGKSQNATSIYDFVARLLIEKYGEKEETI